MENSPENQLAIIILKIGFHLELTITSTSVVVLSLLWHTPLQTPVSMEPLSEKELSNNVVSSEYGKGNKDDEHNTKAYDLEE